MATFDVKYPVFAKLTEEAAAGNTYATGKFIGKQRTLTVTPNMASATLSGDGTETAEQIEEFSNATVALETTFIPLNAYNDMFGATYTAATTGENATPDKIVDKESDEANYGGFGCVIKTVQNKVRKYMVLWLKKVRFSLPAETVTTKGTSVTFGTPQLNGMAVADVSGEWREKTFYATEAEAFAALKAKAGIT